MQTPTLSSRSLWRALIWFVGLVPVLRELLVARSGVLLSPVAVPAVIVRVVFTVASTGGFILAALAIVFGMRWRKGRLPRVGLGLYTCAMCFSASMVLAGFAGLRPLIHSGLFLLPLTLSAVYLLPPVPFDWLAAQIKRILAIQLYGSLVALVLSPAWAIETPYPGIIPGIDLRLNGIVPWGANVLGPLSVLFAILVIALPATRAAKAVNLAACFTVLLLTQSKTAWITMVVVGCVWWVVGASDGKGYRRHRHLIWAVGLLIAPVVLGAFIYSGLGTYMAQQQYVATLSGRTNMWPYVIELWRQNPLFGYGPGLFADGDVTQFAAAVVGGWAPRHAHNQFLQVLGETGIVGVVTYLSYTVALAVSAVRLSTKTRRVSLLVFVLLLVHGVTEVPLRNYQLDGEFFLHLSMFAIFLVSSNREEAPRVHLGNPSRFGPASPAHIGAPLVEEVP